MAGKSYGLLIDVRTYISQQQKGYNYEENKKQRSNTLFFQGPQRAARVLPETLPRIF